VIRHEATDAEVAEVASLLGRSPAGSFRVVVRRPEGAPVVIENAPHLDDGTPMPTLYWLVDPLLHDQVSRIESDGGVHRFEELVDSDALACAHDEYRRRRDALVQRHDLPQPSGGVGGTRIGIKCLHAHLAAHLAGMDDPVGALVASQVDLGPLETMDATASAEGDPR
jgi:uncharacterized protein